MDSGYIEEPLRAALGDADPVRWLRERPGETFREKDARRTLRFELNGRSYFAKLHRGPGVLGALREWSKEWLSLRTPPLDAAREAHALQRLQDHGVSVPRVVAWGVRGRSPLGRESFLVTEDVGTQRTLGEALDDLDPADFMARRSWVRAAATLVRQLHAAGVNHRDLYLGHILAKEGDGAPDLTLIDLHRAQIWSTIPLRWLAKDLGCLAFAALETPLTRTDRLRFVKEYARVESVSRELRKRAALWSRVMARQRRLVAERTRKGGRFGG